MRNRAFLTVVLLGLLTLAFAPGQAAAAGQGLSEMLASSAAARATQVSGPIAAASPLSFDFGIVNVGASSAAQLLTISNIGDEDLHVSAIVSSDPAFSTDFVGPATIPPGTNAGYNVTFTAPDHLTHSGSLTIQSDASNGNIMVNVSGEGNGGPTLDPIGNKSVDAFTTLAFTVTATDPDLVCSPNPDPPPPDVCVPEQVTFSMIGSLPPGATFSSAGEFSWTPTGADAGTYPVTFCVEDPHGLSDCENITITVTVTNSPPTANAGGSYLGTVGVAVQFNGTGTDPDVGQTLSFSWTFGDGGTSNQEDPQHTYGVAGNYLVSLEVCDNGSPPLCAQDFATAQIITVVSAQIILKNNGSTIRTSGGGRERVGIEQTTRPATEIDISTIRMSTDFPGAGSVSEIPALSKGVQFGDMDADGVTDLDVVFDRRDINALLGNVPNNTAVNIIITGLFVTPTGSTPFRGEKTITVKSGGGPVEAAAYPNPFNPETAIAYTSKISGNVTMRVYSIDGRLVRTLKEGEYTEAGTHEVRWNGIDNVGRRVPSGVYFVKTSVGRETSIFKLAVTK